MKTINSHVQQHEQIQNNLIDYIHKEFIKDENITISPDYPLLDKGVIDSLSIMTLIIYIEKQYNLDFYNIEITRDSFESVNSIMQLIIAHV